MREYLVGDHFCYSCDLTVWCRGYTVGRNKMQYPCIDIYIYIYIYILSILLLSYGTDKENSKSQASLAHSHFLLTSMFDSAAML